MIKVRLKHRTSDAKVVYSTLAEHGIQIIKTTQPWEGCITTCIFEGDAELLPVLKLLNKASYWGVTVKSIHKVFDIKSFITWWRD